MWGQNSPDAGSSGGAGAGNQGVTQSDDDLEDVQSAAVRNFLKSSKPHRSAPVADNASEKRHSTGSNHQQQQQQHQQQQRTGPSGLGSYLTRVYDFDFECFWLSREILKKPNACRGRFSYITLIVASFYNCHLLLACSYSLSLLYTVVIMIWLIIPNMIGFLSLSYHFFDFY